MSQAGSKPIGAASMDVVVVGGGFAGLYMLHKLRGLGFSARVFEAGSGIGGTWFWNRYPGARVDIQSLEYSYQFDEELQQEWQWSERYAPQGELLTYANHVAERFGLWPDIQLNTRVTGAHFNEATGRWAVETDKGDKIDAGNVVMATGCLSSTNTPNFEGLDSFKGRTFHTGRWPHEPVDFSGRRVGIIGTGSSAIQTIPIIAQQAKHLTVFQRTPNYSSPAHNGPIPEETVADIKGRYPAFRAANMNTALGADWGYREDNAMDATPEEREAEYELRWQRGGLSIYGSYADLLSNPEANQTAAEFFRGKIRQIVKDPAIAAKLSPTTFVGCKRVCVDTGYYATYNRDNVTLVDVKAAPIQAVTPTGLRTADASYEFDDLIFATGFDAMTGALTRMDIRGRGNVLLKDAWAEGPKSYLGLQVVGFPNLFIMSGPQSGGGQFNFTRTMEGQTDYVAWLLKTSREHGNSIIDDAKDAEIAYAEHCRDADIRTRPFRDCLSYYNGDGNAAPGSLAYYGGPQKWHEIRMKAQETLEPYVFEQISA